MKRIWLIGFVFIASITSAQTIDSLAQDTLTLQEDTKIYYAVEQQAEFPGGLSAYIKFLKENLIYPKDAHKMGAEGKIFVKFIVKKDGSISEPEIIKGISMSLNAEAIRLVTIMPKWKPGRHNGMAVNSQFVLPIYFRIDN